MLVAASLADLIAALKASADGDVIYLEPGDFAGRVSGFSKRVTITSADLAEPANVAGLRLNGCTGLTLSLLDLRDALKAKLLEIDGCDQITLAGLVGVGDLPANIARTVEQIGVNLRNSTRTAISGCDLSGLARGIVASRADDTLITGSLLHDLAFDGISAGTVSRFWVVGNSFTAFKPPPGAHPDGVAITRTRQGAPSRDIWIVRNFFNTARTQGVHVGKDSEAYRHERITVSGNIMVMGSGYQNQVHVTLTDGVRIGANVVLWPEGAPRPFIRTEGNTGERILANRAGGYMPYPPPAGNDELGEMSEDEVRAEVVGWSSQALAGKVLAPA